MLKRLEEVTRELLADRDMVSSERRGTLENLAAYIVEKKERDLPARFIYICTHNSRRSQISQCWSLWAAAYFQMDFVGSWSGGTEVTAFFTEARQSLVRHGFPLIPDDTEPSALNTRFLFSDPILQKIAGAAHLYSKIYTDEQNPATDFAAIMTCSSADANCPLVPGAEKRISLPFEDPKRADEAPVKEKEATYDATTREIGREILLAFSMAQAQIGQ